MKTTKQRQIANKLGISESYLSRIISGIRRPAPEIAELLSKMTSTDIKVWLFNTEKNISVRGEKIRAVLDFKDITQPTKSHSLKIEAD